MYFKTKINIFLTIMIIIIEVKMVKNTDTLILELFRLKKNLPSNLGYYSKIEEIFPLLPWLPKQ